MGITSAELYGMTPRQFWNRLHGWEELQMKGHRERWEQTRTLAFWSLVPHIDSKKKELKKTDIEIFPWDNVAIEKPKITRAEILQKLKEKGTTLSKNLNKELNAN